MTLFFDDFLDGGSARRKATTYTGQHNTEKCGHTSMPQAGFEPTIPVFEQLKTVRLLGPPGLCFLKAFHENWIRIMWSELQYRRIASCPKLEGWGSGYINSNIE